MAVISLEKVNKYYYSRRRLVHAVKDLDMEIKDGEFVSIVGPSGCGKSSTMRMIAGLEGITDGAIRFDGKVVNSMSPAERNVALAFESYALYQHMTVRENISFCLRNKKLSRQQIKEQVDWVTELLSIGNILELKPVSLSGGQQQLVSLARALVRKPSVTLLDEPISHLDSRSRKDISLAIRRVHRELGLTLIYVTHNQEEAFALADRIAVMNEGVLQQVGTREEILSKPANLFVAEFIGDPSMNIIRCRVVQDEGQPSLVAVHDARISFPVEPELALAITKDAIDEVFVGIRPIDLKPEKEDQSDVTIIGKVKTSEYLGEKRIVKLDNAGLQISMDTEPIVNVKPGDEVALSVNPRYLRYFNAKTGLRIGS